MALTDYSQLLMSGLVIGMIYALLAVGLVMIHNVSGVLNFAHGGLAILAAFLALSLTGTAPITATAVLVPIIIIALLAGLLERVSIRLMQEDDHAAYVIITVGLALALSGATLLIWDADIHRVPPFSPGAPLKLAGMVINLQGLWIIGITLLIMTMLYFFFEKTFWGKAFRACMINSFAGRLVGISPSRMSLFAFIAGGAMAALAGIISAPITLIHYDMGLSLTLKGFIAAIVGGITSVPGAVIGGLIIGLTEALAAAFISSGYKEIIPFAVLLLILFIRPRGLLGEKDSKRL